MRVARQNRKEGGRKGWIKERQKERTGEDKGDEVFREMEEGRDDKGGVGGVGGGFSRVSHSLER